MPNRDGSLSAADKRAIRALQKLALRWPEGLTLFSWSGSLVVLPTADVRGDTINSVKRSVTIHGIENDGGDPHDYSYGDDDGADWEGWRPTD